MMRKKRHYNQAIMRPFTIRIVRAGAVTGDAVTLEGFDSTNLSKYPAGAGIGSVRRILTWDQLSQIKNVSTSGGEQ